MDSPPVEFVSLPLELKARVLDLVAWQEEAWTERRKREHTGQDGHVNGLAAASLVCKQWRSLTARHLFHTLSSTRVCLPAFRHLVFRLHAQHFTRVIFDDIDDPLAPTTAWDLAFSLLPSLPNLRSLVLNFFAAHFLFGPELALDVFARDEEIGMRVSSLNDLARRVQDLTLIDFRPAQAAKLLGVWPNLRRFRLVHEAPSPKDATFALPKALRGLKHLHTLELSCHSFVDMMSASAGIELFQQAAPPVTTLRIEALTVEESQFIFISCFASTLTTLSITLNRCTDTTLARLAGAALSPAPVDLPLLTSLSLTTVFKKRPSTMARRPLPILSVFLGAFSSAPLLHLHLNDLSESIDVGETSPLTLLATKFPTLRQISIEPRNSGVGITASEFTHLAAFCAARGLPPPTQTPFEGCFTRGMEDGGGHSAVVCDGMERVLEFGAREIARVRRADNVRETRVLLEVLRPLEEYRRRWLD